MRVGLRAVWDLEWASNKTGGYAKTSYRAESKEMGALSDGFKI
jgi:hypothetical protein